MAQHTPSRNEGRPSTMNSNQSGDAFLETATPSTNPQQPPKVSLDDIGRLNRTAQLYALVNGFLLGLGNGLVGRKVVRLSRNASTFIGLASGCVFGYVSSQGIMTRGMEQLKRQAQDRARSGVDGHDGESAATAFDLRSGAETNFNAGVGGMHEFVDETATTRGDH